MSCAVKYINDGDLPDGVDWSMVRRSENGALILVVRRSALSDGDLPYANLADDVGEARRMLRAG